MEREQYFQKMRETSKVVDPLIKGSIKPLKDINRELYNFIINIPAFKKRIEKKEKLRPFLLRLSYELIGGKDWKKIAYACAAVELLNISTYIDNAVFDNKNNINDKDKPNYTIAARIIRNIAEKTLKEATKKDYEKLVTLLREIDHDVYVAQFEDINQLKINRKFMRIDNFLRTYLHRCEWITGRFIENIAKMGAILAKGIEEQIQDLGEIGKNIGIIVQIINDIGDFVPSEEGVYDYEKVYQDQFSDIKQGKITLPTYYVLLFGSDKEKKLLKKVLSKPSKNEELKEVAKTLVESGAIEFSKELAKTYSKKAQEGLDNFDNSETKEYFKIMSQMYRTNKYLTGLKNRFGKSRRKKYLVLVDKNDKEILQRHGKRV